MLLVGPPQFGWELAFGLRVGKLMQPNIPQAGLFQGVYLSFFMQKRSDTSRRTANQPV